MHLEPDGFHIAGIDDRPRTDKEIADIEHSLMMHQRPELASYYGMMVGHDLLGSSRLSSLAFKSRCESRKNSGGRSDDQSVDWLGRLRPCYVYD